jgi:exodeoxyribonuclease-3
MNLRIITINLNGIRSAARKGLFAWLKDQNADVICMQELKAQESDMQDSILRMPGYQEFFHCAEKRGYSGVGIYSRHKPKQVKVGLGWDVADQEGRYVAINLGNVWIASLYMPSGTSGDHRQTIKYDFLDKYAHYLQNITKADESAESASVQKQEYIICGDWNIAHKNIDLKNWRSNQKTSGFLPQERAWMDKLFGDLGFVDAFRVINQEPDQYTWWSQRSKLARVNNVGWRIDYQVVTPSLKPTIKSAIIYTEQQFSDHAPVLIDYDIIL